MQDGDWEKLQRVLSPQRLRGYQSFAAKHACTPVNLYRWNILLSESLYPSLQTIEILLRNTLHTVIAEYYADNQWLLHPRILDQKEQIEIKKQELLLRRANKPVSIEQIIPELSFGFWTSLLDARYEMTFWRSKIIKRAFPHMAPSDRMRHKLSRHFNQIRKLRNRIFHYEPIWHWQDLKERHQEILLAIQWIEPAAVILCQPDRFPLIYTAGPKAIQEFV